MKRSIQLDFLRFCGVFLVMINHMYITNNSLLCNIFKVISFGGWIGVDLFFVLSGYLVSGLIFNEYKRYNSFNSKNFLIRRGFKIYPTYYFFLFFSFLFFTHFTNYNYKSINLFYESIFVSNYFGNNNGHLWSICVEEHFYFSLALVFYLLIKYKKVHLNTFLIIYVFLLILGLVCRYYNYLHYTNYNFDRDYTKSHVRFDALFFGVLLAYIANYNNEWITTIVSSKFNIVIICICLGFLSTNFIYHREDYSFIQVVNLSINPVCFGYLMLNIIRYKNVIFLKIIGPLAYIGKYSYSIYLFHKLFNVLAFHIDKSGGIKYYILYFFTAIIGGIIISKCIEYPLINIRERFFPSRSAEPQVLIQPNA